MNPTYKPAGYTSLAPYLVVTQAAPLIEFLKQVFDARELRRFTDPTGRIAHAEVRIDDTVLMLGEASGAFAPVPAHVHVFVADADTVYTRAIALGAVSIHAPVVTPEGDKRGGFKDAGGIEWWVSTQISQAD
jgi:uncharacterized glyoxalase superfamily protein PhnB